jgi:hypothetical protein
MYIKCPHLVPQSQKYIIIVAITEACDKWMNYLKSIQELFGRDFFSSSHLCGGENKFVKASRSEPPKLIGCN